MCYTTFQVTVYSVPPPASSWHFFCSTGFSLCSSFHLALFRGKKKGFSQLRSSSHQPRQHAISRELLSTFRMNTYISVSKQRTLSIFRMNTYAKNRGRAQLLLTNPICLRRLRSPRLSLSFSPTPPTAHTVHPPPSAPHPAPATRRAAVARRS